MSTTEISNQVQEKLHYMKTVGGVENVVLTQKDGNPIASAGVWLSESEIFNVVAAASAIYNAGIQLHTDNMTRLVIEGQGAKILLMPLQSNPSQGAPSQMNLYEYFISITTMSNANLGNLFIKSRKSLSDIHRILVNSGLSFLPPLRDFNNKQVDSILKNFKAKDETEENYQIKCSQLSASEELINECNGHLDMMMKMLPGIAYVSISLSGGFPLIYKFNDDRFYESPANESSLSHGIFTTSAGAAWYLKKTRIEMIHMDCRKYTHFLLPYSEGLISLYALKGNRPLGYMKLLFPKYVEFINKSFSKMKVQDTFDTSFIK
ncbi:MAG: roadblock/LC7 domain-containing protein [Candidatus Hodarchaeota archaeon]